MPAYLEYVTSHVDQGHNHIFQSAGTQAVQREGKHEPNSRKKKNMGTNHLFDVMEVSHRNPLSHKKPVCRHRVCILFKETDVMVTRQMYVLLFSPILSHGDAGRSN